MDRLAPRAAITAVPPPPLVVAALCVYAFSLPLETPERPIPLEVHTATGALLLAAALWHPRVCFARPHAAFWPFALYLYIYVCLGVMTEHLAEWSKEAIGVLQVLLIFWVASNLMRRPQVATRVLAAFIAACVLLAALQRLGVTTSVAEVGSVAERLTALGQNPNTFAHNMTIGLLALAGLAYGTPHAPRVLRLGAWALLGLLATVIMPTAARGALLALLAGLPLLVLARAGATMRLRNAAVAVLLLAALGVAVQRSNPMRDRLVSVTENADLAQRERIFPAAWAMVQEKPFVGWGPINNRYELQRQVPRTELPFREAHNLVLELLTQTGIVGALPFLTGLGMCVRASWRARQTPLGVIPLTLMSSVLIALLATSGIYTKVYWFVFALAAGCDLQMRDRAIARRPLVL